MMINTLKNILEININNMSYDELEKIYKEIAEIIKQIME